MNSIQQQSSTTKKQYEQTNKRSRRLFSRKYKFTAALLAALLPGLGHIYLGMFRKGVSFIFVLILDISALLYFTSIGMHINVPLLILLGLIIPITYFYNLFDVLQAADFTIIRYTEETEKSDGSKRVRRNPFAGEKGVSFGILLVLGGTLLILFHQKPVWLGDFIELHGKVTVAIGLVVLGMGLWIREMLSLKKKHNIRVGSYTAALLLMVTGALLTIDEVQGSEYMLLLLKWWPLLAVIWGLEFIIIYIFAKGSSRVKETSLRLDLKGLSLTILLTASVFIVSQQAHYLYLWNKVSLNLTASSVDYSEQEGAYFKKEVVDIPVTIDSENVVINNINGNIRLHREPIDNIQISTEVWVDQIEGPEVDAIFAQSVLEINEGPTLDIQTNGKAYGQSGKRQPRMNLTIALPENRRFNYDLRTMNGNIILDDVEAIEDIKLESANGRLEIKNVLGNIQGKTFNGIVRIINLAGNADITSSQGNMEATDTSGTLRLSTQVGNITVIRAGGDVDIRTKNGNMYVSQPFVNLKAESLNGSINVYTHQIGGNWDIYSAVGMMGLNLPLEGNYKLSGSIAFGDIHNSIPAFTVYNKKIWGTIGEGDYTIRIEGNSDLNVNVY